MPKVQINAVDYDSFISVADADIYLAGDVSRAVQWALKNNEAKARGLISATRMLASLPWVDPAPTYDGAPQVVQDVTAMLAADLLAAPRLFADASGNSNIKLAKAGSAQVEFFRPLDGGPPIPRALWDLLIAAGLVSLDPDSAASDAPFVSGISGGCRPEFGRYPWDWPIASADYG